jgi:hypothetical protein
VGVGDQAAARKVTVGVVPEAGQGGGGAA